MHVIKSHELKKKKKNSHVKGIMGIAEKAKGERRKIIKMVLKMCTK